MYTKCKEEERSERITKCIFCFRWVEERERNEQNYLTIRLQINILCTDLASVLHNYPGAHTHNHTLTHTDTQPYRYTLETRTTNKHLKEVRYFRLDVFFFLSLFSSVLRIFVLFSLLSSYDYHCCLFSF